MTAIFNTLVNPDGAALPGRNVTLQLVTAGFIDGDHSEILRTAYATTDVTGRYEFDDVEPNAAIVPAGTYYLLREAGQEELWTIVVPDSPTALWVKDLLVDNPPSPTPVVAGVVQVVQGANVTVDNTDPQRPVVSASGGGSATVTALAGATLSGHRVVRPQSDGSMVYASNDQIADVTRSLFLTLGAASSGAPVTVQVIGQVAEPTWNWSDGPIFLGANGVLTQTPPTLVGGAVFIEQVASSDGPTGLFWNPRTPIVL